MSKTIFFEGLEEKLEELKTDSFYRPYLEELIEAYEADKETDTYADYKSFMCFFTTGSRAEYEAKVTARRRKLGQTILLSLLYEEHEEYLDTLCEVIWDICSEITWVLPAHLRDIPVEHYRTHIDLRAASTAHTLAEADYLLGDRLPSTIRKLIRQEVKERVFDAFESRPYFWEKIISNWPGVCAGGVGAAYLYLAPERFEGVKDRILAAMENFCRSYGDDGSTTEGVSYWQFGFWSYLNFADLLYRYSKGEIDLRHGEKEDKMATFIQKFTMRKNIAVSFSDSFRTYDFTHIGLFGYLSKNYDGMRIQAKVPDRIGVATNGNPAFLIRDFLWAEKDCYEPDSALVAGMEYIEDAQWYLVKKENYSFAAKGGHNDEGHNHNDVGNFILATDDGQMIADLGAMEYTATCFSKYRYTLLQNSSLGHSVPIIDGKAQRGGVKAHANIVEVSDTKFVMELQEAYETDIPKITRSFEMLDEGIVMTDVYGEIEGHEITERFISVVEPKVEGTTVRIGKMLLRADGRLEITKETLKNKQCVDEDVWLIDYKVTDKTFEMKIEVEG